MRRLLALLLLAAALTLSARSGSGVSYMFRRGDSQIISGNLPLNGLGALAKRYQGDFLWTRVDGKEYIIRDAATLDAARGAFVEVDAFHARYHAISEKMRPVEQRHRKLERQIDELGDTLSDDDDLTSAQRAEMEAKLAKLEAEIKPIEAELRRLEAQEEKLDQQTEVLEEAAERKLEEIIRDAVSRGRTEKP
jgi:hypothetical protein